MDGHFILDIVLRSLHGLLDQNKQSFSVLLHVKKLLYLPVLPLVLLNLLKYIVDAGMDSQLHCKVGKTIPVEVG